MKFLACQPRIIKKYNGRNVYLVISEMTEIGSVYNNVSTHYVKNKSYDSKIAICFQLKGKYAGYKIAINLTDDYKIILPKGK